MNGKVSVVCPNYLLTKSLHFFDKSKWKMFCSAMPHSCHWFVTQHCGSADRQRKLQLFPASTVLDHNTMAKTTGWHNCHRKRKWIATEAQRRGKIFRRHQEFIRTRFKIIPHCQSFTYLTWQLYKYKSVTFNPCSKGV